MIKKKKTDSIENNLNYKKKKKKYPQTQSLWKIKKLKNTSLKVPKRTFMTKYKHMRRRRYVNIQKGLIAKPRRKSKKGSGKRKKTKAALVKKKKINLRDRRRHKNLLNREQRSKKILKKLDNEKSLRLKEADYIRKNSKLLKSNRPLDGIRLVKKIKVSGVDKPDIGCTIGQEYITALDFIPKRQKTTTNGPVLENEKTSTGVDKGITKVKKSVRFLEKDQIEYRKLPQDSAVFAQFIKDSILQNGSNRLLHGIRSLQVFYNQFSLDNYYSVSLSTNISVGNFGKELNFEDATLLYLMQLYWSRKKFYQLGDRITWKLRTHKLLHKKSHNTGRSGGKLLPIRHLTRLSKRQDLRNHLANFYGLKRVNVTQSYSAELVPCPLTEVLDVGKVKSNTEAAINHRKFNKYMVKLIADLKKMVPREPKDTEGGVKKRTTRGLKVEIWKHFWILKHLAGLNKIKTTKTKKVGPVGRRFVKILELTCTKGNCQFSCKTVDKCSNTLNKLPKNILQHSPTTISNTDTRLLYQFLDDIQLDLIKDQMELTDINKNTNPCVSDTPTVDEKLNEMAEHEQPRETTKFGKVKQLNKPIGIGKIPGAGNPLILEKEIRSWKSASHFGEVNLNNGTSSFCEYAKVIRTPGLSRGYHKKSTKLLSKADFTGLYKRGNSIKIRIKRREGTNRFEDVKSYLNFSKNPGLVKLFGEYVQKTKPALTYYLVRKRSYLKKRKVFINSFKLKIAKDFNRQNKLFHQIKTIYFRGRNRKTLGNITRSTKKFLSRELFKIGNSKLLKKKKYIYNKYGHDSMNELLLKFL